MPELFGLRINQKIKRQDTAAEKKAAKASSSKSKKGKPKTTSPMQRMRSGTAHPSKKTSKLDKMPKGFGSRPVALKFGGDGNDSWRSAIAGAERV